MNTDLIYQEESDQMINYLRVTGLPLGLIMNFKNARLEYKRVVPYTQNFIQRKS
jgi:GxxExxY protein